MKDGFVKVAAATMKTAVASPKKNVQEILKKIETLKKEHVKVMVFPELAVSGYSCRDLFLQDKLLKETEDGLLEICDASKDVDALIFLGMPLRVNGKLYNVAAAISHGEILGFVPKKHLPVYHEFYERRQFTPGTEQVRNITFHGKEVPFGMNLLFRCVELPELCVAAEICEDAWVPMPPNIAHTTCGATVVVNLSASNELIGKSEYRRELILQTSARNICGYIYSSAGPDESTTDLVFGGHDLIAENGTLLAESKRFQNGEAVSEIDVKKLESERQQMSTYPGMQEQEKMEAAFGAHVTVPFHLKMEKTELTRTFAQHPFVPSDETQIRKRAHEILNIQAMGLRKRLAHTHAKCAVIGISGGLDSTLALLVAVRAFDLLNMPRKQILAVTMPGFGTTGRTYQNALELMKLLGVTVLEKNIKDISLLEMKLIGHDPKITSVTYENVQARARTEILMNLANEHGGLVIGTGDLSELALGWATYNGDHMSMYAVNASVPKTLVRYLIRYEAEVSTTAGAEKGENADKLRKILLDILDTPVSPELLPADKDQIVQKTEDLVGPYELHDFFLYYMMRFGFSPEKIYRLAVRSFDGVYTPETIEKWLRKFYWRFVSQQFKRSCLPDGPKVGSVAVSPRGDLRMPSDAEFRLDD